MRRGRKSICPSALQEFVEGVDNFSAVSDDLLDLPSPPMRKSRSRRRSISTTPIKSKFRDAFTVSASLACLRSAAEFETANFFASARPPAPVRAEFCPLEEEIVVVDITQASPLREVTNLAADTRGKSSGGKQQQRSWTFSLIDVQAAVTKAKDDEYQLRIQKDEQAFVLICPRQAELTSYLIDCELLQKGGAEDPAENVVPQEQLDQFFDDIDCESQAQSPVKDDLDAFEDSFLRDDNNEFGDEATQEQKEAAKNRTLRLTIRDFVKGTQLWNPQAAHGRSYDEIYRPFEEQHNQVMALYDYPIVSRPKLDRMQVNPTTRDGKMAILQRVGVEKLISQNSQRAQQDLDLEKSLGVHAKKKAWGFDYVDLHSRQKLAFEEWSARYMNHIGKECGCIEVSTWHEASRSYRAHTRSATDALEEEDVLASTPPAMERHLQAAANNQNYSAEKANQQQQQHQQRSSPKVLVRVAREQRKSPATRSSPQAPAAAPALFKLATPPPPEPPMSPAMASGNAESKLTIDTACPTPPHPSVIMNSPSQNQPEKRSPTGFRQRLEFSIQSAESTESAESANDNMDASPVKGRRLSPAKAATTPVQKRPQTPKTPSSPAPSPPNECRPANAPKTPSPRERRLVSSAEQPFAQPVFAASPLVDRALSTNEAEQAIKPQPQPQPVIRAPLPKKIPHPAGVAEKARNAIEQRLWDRWDLALRQYNWELVSEEAVHCARRMLGERQ